MRVMEIVEAADRVLDACPGTNELNDWVANAKDHRLREMVKMRAILRGRKVSSPAKKPAGIQVA
jgi:hypothetical protein